MRVLIAGSSGFLGRNLTARLRTDGHDVRRLVRGQASADSSTWDAYAGKLDAEEIEAADVVINLAGSPTAGNPHSKKWATELRSSRVETTRVLSEAIAASTRKPAFLAGNGISYYGDHGDAILTETFLQHRRCVAHRSHSGVAVGRRSRSFCRCPGVHSAHGTGHGPTQFATEAVAAALQAWARRAIGLRQATHGDDLPSGLGRCGEFPRRVRSRFRSRSICAVSRRRPTPSSPTRWRPWSGARRGLRRRARSSESGPETLALNCSARSTFGLRRCWTRATTSVTAAWSTYSPRRSTDRLRADHRHVHRPDRRAVHRAVAPLPSPRPRANAAPPDEARSPGSWPGRVGDATALPGRPPLRSTAGLSHVGTSSRHHAGLISRSRIWVRIPCTRRPRARYVVSSCRSFSPESEPAR